MLETEKDLIEIKLVKKIEKKDYNEHNYLRIVIKKLILRTPVINRNI